MSQTLAEDKTLTTQNKGQFNKPHHGSQMVLSVYLSLQPQPGEDLPLRRLEQDIAQHIVFLIQRLHLLVQGGAELAVDEHKPAGGTGQDGDGHRREGR